MGPPPGEQHRPVPGVRHHGPDDAPLGVGLCSPPHQPSLVCPSHSAAVLLSLSLSRTLNSTHTHIPVSLVGAHSTPPLVSLHSRPTPFLLLPSMIRSFPLLELAVGVCARGDGARWNPRATLLRNKKKTT